MLQTCHLLAAAVVVAAPAHAIETPNDGPKAKVTLTDGRVLEGTIEREIDGYIYLNLGIGTRLIKPDEYTSIEREGGTAGAAPVDLASTESYRDFLGEKEDGVYRGAVITLEGTVGTHMCAPPLRDAIDELEADGVDILVLKVNSGGGMVLEVEKMSNVIQDEFKPRFHTVAWIESAISAAAMTSFTCPDIYFMPKGNFGAATAWSGDGKAVEGRSLEEILYLMERVAQRGGHMPELFRSMQVLEQPISYDKDAVTGEVTLYPDTSGENILNDGTDILSLNSVEASNIGFSAGTSETLAELERQIIQDNPDLNIKDIVWVGDTEETELFPISEAERVQRTWREEADFIENRLNEVMIKYERARGTAETVPSFIVRAERYLSQLQQLAKRHVNLAFTRGLSEEFFRQEREYLGELRRGG